jgi:multidrug resistance efflux pump
MSSNGHISTPLPLRLRRMQYQVLPVVSLVVCASLAAWIWSGQSTSATASGEVEAIRVEIESAYEGVLEEIPRPIKLFDTVKAGQIVARLDTSAAEAELRRLEQELPGLSGGIDPATAPAGSGIASWYLTRIDELRQQIARRELKSPIDGTVTAIFKRPGEGTVLGKPILAVSSSKAESIIGYLREDRMVRPTPGMIVIIQTRAKPSRQYRSYITTVGAQVEELPYRHWRNPQVMEWGWPIQAAMPPDADLAPGELLELIVKPAKKNL